MNVKVGDMLIARRRVEVYGQSWGVTFEEPFFTPSARLFTALSDLRNTFSYRDAGRVFIVVDVGVVVPGLSCKECIMYSDAGYFVMCSVVSLGSYFLPA